MPWVCSNLPARWSQRLNECCKLGHEEPRGLSLFDSEHCEQSDGTVVSGFSAQTSKMPTGTCIMELWEKQPGTWIFFARLIDQKIKIKGKMGPFSSLLSVTQQKQTGSLQWMFLI